MTLSVTIGPMPQGGLPLIEPRFGAITEESLIARDAGIAEMPRAD